MPYNEAENGISPELSVARRDANQVEAEVARNQERVGAIAEKIQAMNASIDASRQQIATKAKLVVEGDADAMAAAKQLASEAQDKTAERDVLTVAQEAATADLRAAEASLAAAKR